MTSDKYKQMSKYHPEIFVIFINKKLYRLLVKNDTNKIKIFLCIIALIGLTEVCLVTGIIQAES